MHMCAKLFLSRELEIKKISLLALTRIKNVFIYSNFIEINQKKF
jgi:hypothetical protein